MREGDIGSSFIILRSSFLCRLLHGVPSQHHVVPNSLIVERAEADLAPGKGLIGRGHGGRFHVVEIDGDLAVFRTAGAYGATMASTYNSRSLVPEVLVDGDRYIVVADRIAAGTIMAAERVPDWID